MPVCKNCKKRIDRFNKDRCPICGVENPFEGMSSNTVEITTNIDVDAVNVDYHPRRKKKMLLFFCLIGVTGIPFFYLHRKLLGFLQIIWSLTVFIGIAVPLTYLTNINSTFCALIGLGAMYIINIVIGLSLFLTPNLKDGDGEFLL